MHTLRLIEKWHLVIVAYTEPFTGNDIVEVARELGAPGPNSGEHLCILADLRAVKVSGFSASDSQRSVAVRKSQLSGQPAEPLAFLLADMRDYGSVRMHSQWAEANGLRREEDTFATTSLRDALDWLESRTGQPGLAVSVAADPRLRGP